MTQATRQVHLSAPWLDERDEELVLETMRSGWLSLGPTGPRFEELLADAAGARHCAAVSSGTAGLHLSMLLVGVGPCLPGKGRPATLWRAARWSSLRRRNGLGHH